MTTAPAIARRRPGGLGKRRFRSCTVRSCGRGFYGPEGPCPDCREGTRLGALMWRFQVERAGQPGVRKRLRRLIGEALDR